MTKKEKGRRGEGSKEREKKGNGSGKGKSHTDTSFSNFEFWAVLVSRRTVYGSRVSLPDLQTTAAATTARLTADSPINCGNPKTLDRKIPIVTESWWTVPNAPRYLKGQISDRIIGATQFTNPTVHRQYQRC